MAYSMSTRLIRTALHSALCVVLAAVIVSACKLSWVFFMTELPMHSGRAFFSALAAFPIGVGIHAILTLAYFGAPIFIGCCLYSYFGAARPTVWRITRWIPASFAMGLLAILIGRAAYGVSWGRFSGWGTGSEFPSSLVLSIGLSTAAVAILRHRVFYGDDVPSSEER